jgi:hypothetical protein
MTQPRSITPIGARSSGFAPAVLYRIEPERQEPLDIGLSDCLREVHEARLWNYDVAVYEIADRADEALHIVRVRFESRERPTRFARTTYYLHVFEIRTRDLTDL